MEQLKELLARYKAKDKTPENAHDYATCIADRIMGEELPSIAKIHLDKPDDEPNKETLDYCMKIRGKIIESVETILLEL